MSSGGGIAGMFTNFTKLSKGLAVFLTGGFLVVFFFPSTVDYLALVPGKTIPFAWNLITAGYIEQSPINLVINVLCLLLLGKVLEPVWGSKELFKFIITVNACTAVCTFVVMIVLYYSSLSDKFLYAPICGFHGVVAGFLVGIKQLMPDQELGPIRLRAKWLPSLFILLSTALCVLLNQTVAYLPFILFGTYTSWTYLRFFQLKSDGSLKGDPSDEFAFTTFFPEILRPAVGTVSNICYKLFCGRKPAIDSDLESARALNGALPGSDPAEASRRRERGARALEERLNVSKPLSGAASEGPSEEVGVEAMVTTITTESS